MIANIDRLLAAVLLMLVVTSSVRAQEPEDSLRVYAVEIVKTWPFQETLSGFGIYLGHGAVISAAHVVGRWPLFSRPRVLVAGLDLPATIIQMGSTNGIDVTLLTVDESRLPLALRMRRNPICRTPPIVGEKVFGVTTEKVVPTHVLSPLFIPPHLRKEYGTLTSELVTPSGSGIFRGTTKCLLGIVSRSVHRYEFETTAGGVVEAHGGTAGYFVPAAEILDFLPKAYRL
jgi:hypothetical protein